MSSQVVILQRLLENAHQQIENLKKENHDLSRLLIGYSIEMKTQLGALESSGEHLPKDRHNIMVDVQNLENVLP